MKKIVGLVVLVFVLSLFVHAGFDFSKIKDRVSEFTLPNGLKFILIEDHSVPIASFVTYANVGATDERIGIYGISHFLEHLAFKGTSEIGTNNAKAEKKILDKMDVVYDQILAEK
ncbi:MAG: insulinase family protein, partial [Candidatus Aminicenantes bacterium]|nr:insulinase family protein [Candidatus Aminicenantes bacterium]